MKSSTLVIGAALALGLFGPVTASANSTAEENVESSAQPAESSECIQRDESGQQRWYGGPDGELAQAADVLQALVDANPDIATGVALCSHYDGAMIFVAPGAPESLNASIGDIVRAYPAQNLQVSEVAASLSELLDLSSQVLGDPATAPGIVSVGPDITTGGLEIGYDPEVWTSEAELRAWIAERVKAPRGQEIPLGLTQTAEGQISLVMPRVIARSGGDER